MLVNSRNLTRGDTLIEVLFSITIFSLVVVGGISIMNQGTATAQRALEITLVRQEVDAQAETLRFLNSSYIAAYRQGIVFDSTTPAGQWQAMTSGVSMDGVSDFGITTCPDADSAVFDESFILNTRTAKFVGPSEQKLDDAKTFSQVSYDGSGQVESSNGIWIEAVRYGSAAQNETRAGYIDFHIRACWDSPGQNLPVTIGTIVRLYEPRG